MRLHVVADVHGNVEALARASDGADGLVVLGDLVDLVDYHDHAGGILGALLGPERVARFAELRRSGAPGEAGAWVRAAMGTVQDPAARIEQAVREQYSRLFAALGAPVWATPGNVDLPRLWPEFARDGVTVLDGASAQLGPGGPRIGLVGGLCLLDGMPSPASGVWRPYLRTEDELAAALAALGPVDLLGTHGPPAVPELCFDTRARRREPGSVALLDHVRDTAPRFALHGHVHQPLARRVRIGRTECVNVGHFQRTGTPHVLHL